MSQHSVKVIVVSNAGKGFGRSIALSYGNAGYDVVCIDDEVDLASKTAAEIEDQGGKAIPIQADVSSSMDVRKAFDKIFEIFGSFDGIVHVASFENKSRFISLTEAEFAEVVGKGLKSSFLVLRSAARFLEDVWLVLVTPPKSAKEPHMVASRGAIVELSKSFKDRYPNLRINVITPSRPASDATHDAILVENVTYLSSGRSGLSGHHLEVELPPPPKVIESLLPEVQAALDDDVRQSDLEASMFEFEDDDDFLGDDDLNDFDDFDGDSSEDDSLEAGSSDSDTESYDSEDYSEEHDEDYAEVQAEDQDAEEQDFEASDNESSYIESDDSELDDTIELDDSNSEYPDSQYDNNSIDDLEYEDSDDYASDNYASEDNSVLSQDDEQYIAENYDLNLVKDVERINRKDED